MKEMFSLGGSDTYESSKNESSAKKEIADVAIGTGLVVAGPEVAKSLFEQLVSVTESDISFLPENESLHVLAESGIEFAQELSGPVAVVMLLYIGYKKILTPFSKNK